MQGIVKRFYATTALDGVDFEVAQGEIHALLGENGAGKSTLMHVLAGITRPDSGEIRIDGQAVVIDSPRTARALSIAMVHQHFTLVPAFTVEENLALDRPGAGNRWFYRPGETAGPAIDRAANLGWEIRATDRVLDLPVGAQQRVEIVKALSTGARIVIFDEPTAVLTAAEVEDLFEVLRRLCAEGHAIILIAHKLAEVLAVADRITVLRRGRNVAVVEATATTQRELAAWMIGARPKSDTVPATEPMERGTLQRPPVSHVEGAALVARAIHVTGDRGIEAIKGLTLEVGRGEIFGIGGVDGNGQGELAEALVGIRRVVSGSIIWDGRPIAPGRYPVVGYIPQDRRRDGLAVGLSIEENLLFAAVRAPEYRIGPFLRRRALNTLARRLVADFDIRTNNPALPAASLSGGNQQKIVVARAMHANPDLIVAVSPTRGLDIGSTRFVHDQLRRARDRGAAVVLISTDLEELQALADRGAILSGGRLNEYSFAAPDDERLGLLLGGAMPTTQQEPLQ